MRFGSRVPQMLLATTALIVGAGGIGLLAAPSGAPSSFVPIAPERVADTRSGFGISSPLTSPTPQDLRITGPSRLQDGTTRVVVPNGATAVVLNVTAVVPQAAGFLSVRPAGMSGAPTTSSLNFDAGVVLPNAVTVSLPASGSIELTYDAYGTNGPTMDVLVDVAGYYTTATAGSQGPPGPPGAQGPQAPGSASIIDARGREFPLVGFSAGLGAEGSINVNGEWHRVERNGTSPTSRLYFEAPNCVGPPFSIQEERDRYQESVDVNFVPVVPTVSVGSNTVNYVKFGSTHPTLSSDDMSSVRDGHNCSNSVPGGSAQSVVEVTLTPAPDLPVGPVSVVAMND